MPSPKNAKSYSPNQKLEELLKDLLILELARSGVGRDGIRRVLGKIDNARVSKIASALKKAKK